MLFFAFDLSSSSVKIGSLKGIISKLFDNADHFGDWQNDNPVGIVGEHERSHGHEKTGKDGFSKLVLCTKNGGGTNVKSRIGNQIFTVRILFFFSGALSWPIADKKHFILSENAWLIRYHEPCTVFMLFPKEISVIFRFLDCVLIDRNSCFLDIFDGREHAIFPEVWDIQPYKFHANFISLTRPLTLDVMPELFVPAFFC